MIVDYTSDSGRGLVTYFTIHDNDSTSRFTIAHDTTHDKSLGSEKGQCLGSKKGQCIGSKKKDNVLVLQKHNVLVLKK